MDEASRGWRYLLARRERYQTLMSQCRARGSRSCLWQFCGLEWWRWEGWSGGHADTCVCVCEAHTVHWLEGMRAVRSRKGSARKTLRRHSRLPWGIRGEALPRSLPSSHGGVHLGGVVTTWTGQKIACVGDGKGVLHRMLHCTSPRPCSVVAYLTRVPKWRCLKVESCVAAFCRTQTAWCWRKRYCGSRWL